MTRFVKLTASNGVPADVRADWITVVYPSELGTVINGVFAGIVVRESPEQILSLLAEPAPTVEVTEAAVTAAWAALQECAAAAGSREPAPGDWAVRAAIEAADRARGLRP